MDEFDDVDDEYQIELKRINYGTWGLFTWIAGLISLFSGLYIRTIEDTGVEFVQLGIQRMAVPYPIYPFATEGLILIVLALVLFGVSLIIFTLRKGLSIQLDRDRPPNEPGI